MWTTKTLGACRLFALLTLATLIRPGATQAAATLITFESFPGPDAKLNTADDVPIVAPGNTDDSPFQITDQYEDLGVKFNLYPYYITNVVVDANSEAPSGTPRNNIVVSAYPYFETPASLEGQFVVPVRAFSIDLVFNVNRYVTIYGASGKLGELYGGPGTRTFNSTEDITLFRVWGEYEADHWPTAIDNVSFTVVPEPATLAAAAGALALASRRSRRAH